MFHPWTWATSLDKFHAIFPFRVKTAQILVVKCPSVASFNNNGIEGRNKRTDFWFAKWGFITQAIAQCYKICRDVYMELLLEMTEKLMKAPLWRKLQYLFKIKSLRLRLGFSLGGWVCGFSIGYCICLNVSVLLYWVDPNIYYRIRANCLGHLLPSNNVIFSNALFSWVLTIVRTDGKRSWKIMELRNSKKWGNNKSFRHSIKDQMI